MANEYLDKEGLKHLISLLKEETADLVAESDRDEFVKGGLTDNEETWTDEDKAKACETIGAPTNIKNGKGVGSLQQNSDSNNANGSYSAVFGEGCKTSDYHSFACGYQTEAINRASFAEGFQTHSTGQASHAEGDKCYAIAYCAHAEGSGSRADGSVSHAEGFSCRATAYGTHAEGYKTQATNNGAHSEGIETIASGYGSHTSGEGTRAAYRAQYVIGTYNNNKSVDLFEIGNGKDSEHQSNAFEVLKDGRAKVYGAPKDAEDVVRLQDLFQDKLSTELAVINTVLEQSGLVSKYKATIEDTYTERVTADGANVLDGSKAKLEKVVGSTVACKNLVDIPKIDASTKDSSIYVNFTQDIFVSAGEFATVSSSIWRFQLKKKDGTSEYITDSQLQEGGIVKRITSDNPVVEIVYRGTYITAGQYSKIMIAYGDTATEYQPYFTGLKSASFAGIESTNADGTETATLDFPKTETPLGVTIDFETKKITDYGVTIELKGTEILNYSTALGDGSVFFSNLVGEEKNAIGVCTDATIVQKTPSVAGEMQIGDGRSGTNPVFWKCILKQLGFWASTDDNTTAVTSFRNYLAQRYADGNPVTIRYVSSTLQSETDFTESNEYTAYKGGTEKVLDNDGKDYGADNTLSQNYIIVTGVK